jgi:ABC-type glycerol-3-phosphate transport system substrate-binding protein
VPKLTEIEATWWRYHEYALLEKPLMTPEQAMKQAAQEIDAILAAK